MKKQISYKVISLVFSVLVVCFAIAFYAVAWSEPTQSPPGGNVPTPLNTGSTGQSKAGGLILNTGGAANGLIVANGNVGIGTTNPGTRLNVNGNIKIVDGNQADGKVLTSDGDGLGTWQRAGVSEHGTVNVPSGQSFAQVNFSQIYTSLPTVVAMPVKVGATLNSDCVMVWITELTNSRVVFDVDSIHAGTRNFEPFPEDDVRIDYVVISND